MNVQPEEYENPKIENFHFDNNSEKEINTQKILKNTSKKSEILVASILTFLFAGGVTGILGYTMISMIIFVVVVLIVVWSGAILK